MTATLEKLGSTFMHGDEALEIFNRYRSHPEIDDRTTVEEVDREFPWLADKLGQSAAYLVRLDENTAGTFKIRGAATGIQAVAAEHGAVQTPSAGNAGRSVAIMGKVIDVPTRIVVPTTAPRQKRQGIRDLWPGGTLRVKEEGQTFDDSLKWAKRNPDGYGLLHPYDDPNVIAGQGTVVDDLIEKVGPVDHILVPVGGGGLVAGILKRLDELGLSTTVHAIEAEGSNSLSKSLASGKLQPADNPNKKYGGSAVKRIGEHVLFICQTLRHRLQLNTATDEEVGLFISYYEDHRGKNNLEGVLPYEPTSLVPIAKLEEIAWRYPGESIAVLGTGHNDSLQPAPHRSPPTRVWAGTFPK